MTCDRNIHELLRLAPDVRRQHLADCPDCLGRYTRSRLSERVLAGGLPHMGAPTNAQAREMMPHRARPWLDARRLWPAAALAGAAAVLLFFVSLDQPGPVLGGGRAPDVDAPAELQARGTGSRAQEAWAVAIAVEAGKARELRSRDTVSAAATLDWTYTDTAGFAFLGLAACRGGRALRTIRVEPPARAPDTIAGAAMPVAGDLEPGTVHLAYGFARAPFDPATLCASSDGGPPGGGPTGGVTVEVAR